MGVRQGVHVYVLTDALSEYSAITVLADDRHTLNEFVEMLRGHLETLPQEELRQTIKNFSDPSERMHRLMRLAISAPAEFDREVHIQMTQLSKDDDPRVRDAVTLASGYLPWPQMRPVLKAMAEHDAHPTVRQDAISALHLFDDAGVPEE